MPPLAKNIFLELEYVGSNYLGFQIQEKKGPNEVTVQGALEKALKKLFKQKIRVIASGRTDKGVHAKAQVVNFKLNTKIPLPSIKTALNAYLPRDIRIKTVKQVSSDFHARFSVKSKIYRYIIFQCNEDSVFWRNFAWYIPIPLDLRKMRKVSAKLIGRKDFSLFAKKPKNYKDCKRRIKHIGIRKKSGLISIDIEADGFLRYMARNIVSFLVRTASGDIPLKNTSLLFKGKVPYTNRPAPPGGLYLYKIRY